MGILSLVVLAMLGEAIWETVKMLWQDGKASIDKIGAVLVGILLSLGTGADIMRLSGVPMKNPYIAMILTGLLLSRGANFVHDILTSINNIQKKMK
jgi:hypothetical protein